MLQFDKDARDGITYGNVIFKETSTGKTQQWQQQFEGSKYRTVSGQVGGKLVTSAWTQCEGKNIGKANEVTPEQQALKEVIANYKKKLDKDYHFEAGNIKESKMFIPMLAKDYTDHWKKVKVGKEKVFSQPKLDGMRCIAKADGLWSRGGKPIISCPHIVETLKPLFDANPDLILDGELYNHDFHDNFDELMSIFKQQKPKAEDFAKAKQFGQYHIYDMPSAKGGFENRWKELQKLIAYKNFKYIHLVDTYNVNSQNDLDNQYDLFMEDGYEGQIVRLDTPYVNKRTDGLMKRKEWIDSEFELLRFEEGKGNWAGKAKKAWFKHDSDPTKEFKAGVKGSMEYTAELLKNKDSYIGTMCTVIYCPQRTPDGIPRFGRVKEFNRTDNV